MPIMGKKIRALLMLLLQLTTVWLGAIKHWVWAWNLFIFLMWFTTIVVVLLAATGEKVGDKRPLGMSGTWADLVTAAICAAAGHFWYATMATTQAVLEPTLYSTEQPKEVKIAGVSNDEQP